MEGREGMTTLYLNRGLHASPPGFKTQSNPNLRLPLPLPLPLPSSSPVFLHGITSPGSGSGSDSVVKKKRGRPRKYAPPDESHMELALTPASTLKKNRGRPPGSGWKQRLASVGEWMSNSAGLAFTPHVIQVSVGEDVAEKIVSFSQQRPRAICIMSGNGAVSTVTLRQFTSGGTVTYEGRFDILRLSGSYLLPETGGPQNRTGGLSISICSGDGNVIGGAIGGRLIASSLVQVVVCSFVYGGGNNVKPKTKTDASSTDDKGSGIQLNDTSPAPVQKPIAIGWRPDSLRNSRSEIDLTRG